MQMMVYRNLTKGCWSLKNTKTRRVQGHADDLLIFYPIFKVSQKGRERVVREKKKYVHAGVYGIVETSAFFPSDIVPNSYKDSWKRVRYNPYVNKTFVFDDGTEVHDAMMAYLNREGHCYVCNVSFYEINSNGVAISPESW